MTPLGPEADACLAAHFRHFSGRAQGRAAGDREQGPAASSCPEAADGVARFSFEDLCSRPLGAGDYLKIAEAFHTIILADVPVLAPARRNEAKRLINLIDTLYDKHVRLIVSAEAEPDELWQGSEGAESVRVRAHRVAADRDALGCVLGCGDGECGNEKGPGG